MQNTHLPDGVEEGQSLALLLLWHVRHQRVHLRPRQHPLLCAPQHLQGLDPADGRHVLHGIQLSHHAIHRLLDDRHLGVDPTTGVIADGEKDQLP